MGYIDRPPVGPDVLMCSLRAASMPSMSAHRWGPATLNTLAWLAATIMQSCTPGTSNCITMCGAQASLNTRVRLVKSSSICHNHYCKTGMSWGRALHAP